MEHATRDHRDDSDSAPVVTVTKATYLFVLCASLNSCNLGYDIGVSTEASRLIESDMGLTCTYLKMSRYSIHVSFGK